MPELPEVVVTGLPIFGDPFNADALPAFMGGGLSINELAALERSAYPGAAPTPEEAFAPPIPPLPPTLLPEVIVEGGSRVLTAVGAGLLALLFPQPTGPREFDEAPGGGGGAPPPVPPGAEDPIQPPNWWDLVNEPYPTTRPGPPLVPIPLGEPLRPVEMPPGEPYFDVSPPGVTTRSYPDLNPLWLVPTAQPDPFSQPDYYPPEEPYVVPEPAPAPDRRPGPAPGPVSPPGVDPLPRIAEPTVAPEPGTRPLPSSPPSPDPLGDPMPDPFGDPFGDPVPTPREPAPPSPTPREPSGGTTPRTLADPVGGADPLDEPITDPRPRADRPGAPDETCGCDKKPKKKAKPKLREECWKGTYVQRTRGISYIRKEQVPCEAAPRKSVSRRETDAFGRPAPRKRGKSKTPKWGDILDDVFQRP